MGRVLDHDHHSHGHVNALASFGKAFAIGIALNSAFVLIEGGLRYHRKFHGLARRCGSQSVRRPKALQLHGLQLFSPTASHRNATHSVSKARQSWQPFSMRCSCSWPWVPLVGKQFCDCSAPRSSRKNRHDRCYHWHPDQWHNSATLCSLRRKGDLISVVPTSTWQVMRRVFRCCYSRANHCLYELALA